MVSKSVTKSHLMFCIIGLTLYIAIFNIYYRCCKSSHCRKESHITNSSDSETGEKPYRSTNTNTQEPKVAVCVSGQVRTLDMSISSQYHPQSWRPMRATLPNPNETVAESIQRNLFPKLGNPDVFMVVSTRETAREPKIGNLSVCESLRPFAGHLHCSVPAEEPVDIVHNQTLWKYFYFSHHPNSATFAQGLLQQLKGMFQCFTEIQKHSHSTGKTYDWIVRLRPDMYISEFPELDELSLVDGAHSKIFYSDKRACCCGNEDTFAVGTYSLMASYFERFAHLQQSRLDLGLRWTSERHLLLYLKERGIVLAPHPKIKGCIVKPKYRETSSEP